MPRFSTLNVNAGADQSGNLTFTGRGPPVPAVQGTVRRADAGRIHVLPGPPGRPGRHRSREPLLPRAQAGLFASFKHVNFSGGSASGNSLFTDRPVSPFDVSAEHDRQRCARSGVVDPGLPVQPRPLGRLRIEGLPERCGAEPPRDAASNVFTEYYLQHRSIRSVSAPRLV